jgi:hypothetical protein
MRKYRRFLLVTAGLAAVTIVAFFYAGVRRGRAAELQPLPDMLAVLPPGAPTLLYVDLAAVRASSFYQHRQDRAPITVPDSEYAKFILATGFDFEKDLDRVVIASWPKSLVNEQQKTVAVADGRFDHQKIHDYAVRNGKVDQQQGHEVFLFPGKAPNDWNSILFLNDRRIALVEGSSVAPMLAPRVTGSVTDPAREQAERFAGAAVFAITRMPPIPDHFAPGGVQSAQFVSLLRSIQLITLAVRPEGENMRLSLEGECQTTTDARQLASALEMLRVLGRAGLESPKTRQAMDPTTFEVLESLLKTADITVTAERVRVLVEVTPEIFNLSRARAKN